MKKIILFILITTIASCNFFFKLSVDEKLSERINMQYVKLKTPIDLSLITDFDWDNYILLTSYQIPNQIQKKYDIDLSNISEYTTADDSNSILVFIKNKKSVKICKVKIEVKFKKNKLLNE